LLAGLAAAAAAIAFDLSVAERVVDRAVATERHVHEALAVPEPFSRRGQRGGLVAGELLLGAGVAFLFAGAATFLATGARPAARLWLLLSAAGVWSVVVLPAAVYPPLPPGVASSVPIGERQLLYLVVVAAGLAGFGTAVRVWTRTPTRIALALAAAAVPAVLAVVLLPARGEDTSTLPSGLLTDFRIVSVAGQLLFWATLAGAGAAILRR
jgi:hypothetical protein